MKRAILFDTETTGLDPLTGDRVIEIAALELVGDLPTGRHYHVLIDPERDIPEEASRVHGYTRAHLIGQKKFHEVAEAFLAFIGDDVLIAHNAPFDFGFINAEFARLDMPSLHPARMLDTLDMARTRFPGLPNSLDSLCRRFGIDLSERTTHNALLDCRLLAQVYVELMGGRQRGFELARDEGGLSAVSYALSQARVPRPIVPSAEALEAHAAFVAKLKEPVWLMQ
ncbi:DNA polymerase III subunit epsilon [Lichenicola sp.]|uniref:DNA polymerase III subunit epsilon n=1 Tax=Lichenicola sp. TaxID=2804529 RepID=UPI003AFFDE42